MITPQDADLVVDEIRSSPETGHGLRKLAMEKLSNLPGYNWSGVYRFERNMLVLDEFFGAPTDHTQIEVGVGVCGTAIAEGTNQIVKDVRKLDNYLACSLETRSEIVVLVRKGAEILGQIDIDGHEVGAFDESDEKFLERLANVLAERW
ncbi:MAG: GAF domain-containing protein [Chlorobia bacterium]|nr:GAF domain-containing protein [Fimbriimonadaceae bacterium]